jgi:hypothetical protein
VERDSVNTKSIDGKRRAASIFSLANGLGRLENCDYFTTGSLDEEQRANLMPSQWLMFWNTPRSMMVLPLETSMTVKFDGQGWCVVQVPCFVLSKVGTLDYL